MRIPTATKSAQGRAKQLTAERLVNLYAEAAPGGSKSSVVVHGCPGLTRFVDVSAEIPRGLYRMARDGRVFLVAGLSLYIINEDGTVDTVPGKIAGSGRVGMADNGDQLCIVTGSKGYIYESETGLYEIIDKDFPGAETVAYLDGFFIFNNPGSGQKREQFFISNLRDGATYDALDFASAEAYPDNLKRVVTDHSELILFGEQTTEIWFNAGAADFPFRRAQGSIIEKGLGATWSVAQLDESVMWLDQHGIVRRLQGGTPVRMSTHDIEYRIKQGDWENATAWSYYDEGHNFYVLTVPRRNTSQTAGTYVYDAATGLWHERQSKDRPYSRSGFYVAAYGKHLTCDIDKATIYEQSLEWSYEDGELMISEMVFPQVQNDGERFIVDQFRVDMEVGNTPQEMVVGIAEAAATLEDFGEDLTGSSKWQGAIAVGKKVYFPPFSNANGAILNTETNELIITDFGLSLTGNEKWTGGVLASNGKIYCIPYQSSNCLIIDTSDDTAVLSTLGGSVNLVGSYKWSGGVLGDDGKIYCMPFWANDFLIIDPATDTATRATLGLSASGNDKWFGGVKAANGKIYGVPFQATSVLVLDTVAQSATTTTFGLTLSDTYKWARGALASDGKIYCNPFSATDALVIDPVDNSAVRTSFGLTLSGTDKWASSEVGPNGKVYCVPYSANDFLVIDPAEGTAIRSTLGASFTASAYWHGAALLGNKIYGTDYSATDFAVLTFADITSTDYDPQVMLQESSDGRTWGMLEPWHSMGKQGEYSTRVKWDQRGQYETYTAKISISAPVKRAIFAAYAKIRPTR